MIKISVLKLIFVFSFLVVSASFAQKEKCRTGAKQGLVEVLIFHGVKQCETCEAIKKNTKEVVAEKFGEQVSSGNLSFRIVDFSKPENKAIAEKYEIAWTSVVLVKHGGDDQEQVNNISRFAIENARKNTELYRVKLEEEINKLL